MKIENKIDSYLNEDIYDTEGVIGKKRITMPMIATSDEEAIKRFLEFIKNQQKNGHVPPGKISNYNH